MKIEIRGIIVPSEFDGGWYQSLVDRGVITPESKFRKALADANPKEPLEVYINSPGGSVFAGNEMVNAVLAWKMANKQKVNVIIGAMAASMGAAFTIQVADKVSAHRNAMMMFHGAWGVQIGGAEAMKDYAGVLERINAGTKAILVSQYKIAPETVNEWFSEGREGWLTADEMKAAGIAGEIIGADDEAMDLAGSDLADFEAHGLKVAALATGLAILKQKPAAPAAPAAQAVPVPPAQPKTEGGQDVRGSDAASGDAGGKADGTNNKENGHGEGQGAGKGGGQGGTGEAAGKSVHPSQSEDGAQALGTADAAGRVADATVSSDREAGRAEGRASAIAEMADQVTELNRRLEAATANERKMQAERDKAIADAAKARKEHETSLKEMSGQLQLATERLQRHLNGGLAFSPAPATWEDAMTACNGDYAKAARAYPELRKAYNEAHKRK